MATVVRLQIDVRQREALDVSQPGRVKRALKVDNSDDRVILLNWGIEDAPRLCNIARIDRHGAVVWRVALPDDSQPDCFVALRREQDLFVGRTYTGRDVHFDVAGRHVSEPLLTA